MLLFNWAPAHSYILPPPQIDPRIWIIRCPEEEGLTHIPLLNLGNGYFSIQGNKWIRKTLSLKSVTWLWPSSEEFSNSLELV